jgi:hypothetical protein
MQVTVDGTEVELLPGMTVRHAILARYGADDENVRVTDRWGNLVGLDGAVSDGASLHTARRTLTDQ